ncbi:sodium:solute symporter family protein [Polaribacter aquimarinus]|uniref:Na+:solute symporter n=1 Tax=Polaribacter aquimarinus TaxID=2100726 RepID=A0A2U2JA71_9FLAO|nr:sodium:solute symporter family protein [Polaribacter aquimarinus]PWG05240.1 Na+:solute symporter [Polaribacter aquimarinus]
MINLSSLDYILIISFFAIVLFIGIYVSKKSGKSSSEFFLSGRSMPWWLLGFSMVATTFAADTPLLVTDIVRADGVSGNWVWWSFLITGLLTVFVYAKLWRKSAVNTDLEFYELRYSGKAAQFLRGFRAIYLGIIFNVLVMSVVTLAAIKIGGIMLGIQPWEVVVYAGTITVVFSAFGGFRGVVYTDFLLFIIAMFGAFAAAYYAVNLPQVGGLDNLLKNDLVISKMDMLPDFKNTETLITLLIIPIALQWWSSWYPGAEPGGGGYIAQRMLAAKDENHAIGATFFFNFVHYALRPWPWILVALASLVIFPDMASLQSAFPNIPADKLGHDLAYPAMLNFLPSGILGIVLASLIAAYMSTISTHLNWGASYVVNDFYKRFVKEKASEKELVNVGRITTILMMIVSGILALSLTNVKQVFDIIIMFGAGTGLLFILRWFWWRINAWSEIAAMFSSGVISILLNFTSLGSILFASETGFFPSWFKFPFVVLITSIIWLIVTYITQPDSKEVLYSFYQKIQPGGPGWSKVINDANSENINLQNTKSSWSVPSGILAMLLGCVLIYSCLFATGFWIYGEIINALLLSASTLISGFLLIKIWKKIKTTIL